MVAKLPKEHPLVAVDTTHTDQGLEGVFLGWHNTTLSACVVARGGLDARGQLDVRRGVGVVDEPVGFPAGLADSTAWELLEGSVASVASARMALAGDFLFVCGSLREI
eukprot:460959-Rhodomonas_salina.2